MWKCTKKYGKTCSSRCCIEDIHVVIVSLQPPRSLQTKFKLILPYVWPKAEKAIQLRVAGCFAIILLGRIINIYMPLNNKKIGERYLSVLNLNLIALTIIIPSYLSLP